MKKVGKKGDQISHNITMVLREGPKGRFSTIESKPENGLTVVKWRRQKPAWVDEFLIRIDRYTEAKGKTYDQV